MHALHRCASCGEHKPAEQFGRESRGTSGLRARCKECTYWSAAKSRYGVTKESFVALLASQGGKCALCHTREPTVRGGSNVSWNIDHCHETGRVRGILCSPCNLRLGHFKDNVDMLQRAIDYLRRT